MLGGRAAAATGTTSTRRTAAAGGGGMWGLRGHGAGVRVRDCGGEHMGIWVGGVVGGCSSAIHLAVVFLLLGLVVADILLVLGGEVLEVGILGRHVHG